MSVELAPEEVQVILRSYAFLKELCVDEGVDLRSEELDVINKLRNSLMPRTIPAPPPSKYEDDPYAPNVSE